VNVFENCRVEIGIHVVFNSAYRLIAQFCYVLTELVAASVVTVVPPTGRYQATHLTHPPPPTVPSVPLRRSMAVCKVSHVRFFFFANSFQSHFTQFLVVY